MGCGEPRRMSAASTSLACRSTAVPMRPTRKPTPVSAATATVSASNSTPSSPERHSRAERSQREGEARVLIRPGLPASIRRIRPQRAASVMSCVTRTSVVRELAFSSNSSSPMRAAGDGVQVAGGLVREQHRGLRDERARKRHALLLAARELARIVAGALAQADRSSASARCDARPADRRAPVAASRFPAP